MQVCELIRLLMQANIWTHRFYNLTAFVKDLHNKYVKDI